MSSYCIKDQMYYYKIELLRVVDGDTIDVRIDLGFNVWNKSRIRLVGINAPESRTRDKEEKKRGLAAKDWLIKKLESAKDDLEMKSYGVGKYGRVLGEIYIKEVNVNELMVKEGHAVKYDGGKR